MSPAACTFWTLIVLFAFFGLIETALRKALRGEVRESHPALIAASIVGQAQGAIAILLPWVIIWWIWTWSWS